MAPAAHLVDELLTRAARCGGDTAVIHPASDGAIRRVSYDELDRRARAVASWLHAHDAAGRRVLIAMDTGPHQAAALLGCLYAAAVAVPVPAPGDASGTTAARTAAIARDAAAHLVLTEVAHATEASRLLSLVGAPSLTCLAVDGLGRHEEHPSRAADEDPHGPSAARDGWLPARTDPDTLALLSYDSGPATAPRGARLTHGALRVAVSALRAALRTDRTSRVGCWQVRPHTLGLIAQVLHPLWLGATAVLPPTLPPSAGGRAGDWLRDLSRYGVTETAAPDSRYARCAAASTVAWAGVDLSRLRTAVNVGEPVSAATLACFTRRGAAAGLRADALAPGYAPGEAAPWLAVEGRGPVPGAEPRVVDPRALRTLPDGVTGEIWVRGPAVADGYWGSPPDAGRVFHARTAEGVDGFLRTGDLGWSGEGGTLRPTGRLDDLLIADGVPLHPQDVERELLGCGRPLGTARVFCAGPGTGRLVVVQEVRTVRGAHAGLPHLAATIRDRVAREFGAEPGTVLLVRAGTLRRAGGGKVGRSALRAQFLRGDVRTLHVDVIPEAGASPGDGLRHGGAA
ncbi:AMP-binding protein [Streptomyces sp. SAJ15]|uniref:AMP-binding protein n=1 Tax=Streptomyces sp. SAJ15 TaxID=2011095 RepID=UPI001642840E|nr:AMP-binding protein [Streptomyces sp. SAJ15]